MLFVNADVALVLCAERHYSGRNKIVIFTLGGRMGCVVLGLPIVTTQRPGRVRAHYVAELSGS